MSGFKAFKPLTIVSLVTGALVIGLVFAFVFGLFAMLLWNWLMPEIFGLPQISYWQAWGLVLLAHILVKSGHQHHKHDHDHNDDNPYHRQGKRIFQDYFKKKFGKQDESMDDQQIGRAESSKQEEK